MKRLYSTSEWRRQQKIRTRRLERKQNADRHRRRLAPLRTSGRDSSPYFRNSEVRVSAPTVFSLVENLQESSKFVAKIRAAAADRSRIYVDLSRVTVVTPEAALSLIALVQRIADAGTRVRGRDPRDHRAKVALADCGFFEHVHRSEPIEAKRHGSLTRLQGTTVDTSEIRRLVDIASLEAFGRVGALSATIATFGEALGNTQEHAGNKRLEERWWVSCWPDPGEKRVRFSALDLGKGILQSRKIRSIRRAMLRTVRLYGPSDLLRDILKGSIESGTGLLHRGYGLPKIAGYAREGRIARVTILTNSVFCDMSNQTFTAVDFQFAGTLISWEVTGGMIDD